jgi:hypothetical protein
VIEQLCGEHTLEPDPGGRGFVAAGLRVRPPLVFPMDDGVASVEGYLADLPTEPGLHLLVLLQAGAATLGLFRGGQELRTKSLKKYAVRGRGKAQGTYLSTKGKSRYGSRLRLRNALNLLIEVNGKLHEWNREVGPAEHIFYSAAKRLWWELMRCKHPPPFGPADPMTKIPLDLPVPTTEILGRTYRALEHGRIDWLAPPAGGSLQTTTPPP